MTSNIDNLTEWGQQKIATEMERFKDGVIKISKMVDDGKLNSNSAKEVFSDFYDGHINNIRHIKEIDKFDFLQEPTNV